MFLIEPPGYVRGETTSSGERATQAGRTVEETLGIDWATLEAIARTTQVLESEVAGRLRLEPLMGSDGHVSAVLARAEEGGSRPQSTLPPPSSSRWARGLKALVGKDAATRAAVDMALRFAKTSLPFFIAAEEGSGADILARAMHEASNRAQGPFVHVRASTLPRAAAEKVLFGSGAGPHPASTGMLFVEDVHELDVETGRRLARELDRGVLAEAHFVCSAPPDVRDRVSRGTFARELYTQVRGSTVVLPPLREREDLPHLVKQTLTDLAVEREPQSSGMEALRSYFWPGNVAELWGCLEHAAVVAGRELPIGREHLPRGILVTPPAGTEGLRKSAERAAVEEALRLSQGNVSAAAKRLGVARSTLYRLMQRHGLDK